MSSAELQFVPLTRERYGEWDAFCGASDDAWFWHTSEWLEYTLAYRPECRPESQGFLVQLEGRTIGICPLVVEQRSLDGETAAEFGYGRDAGPAPALASDLSSKFRRTVLKGIFGRVDEIAEAEGVQRAAFRLSPLAPRFWRSTHPAPNPLLYYGLNDISVATQVVDLSLEEVDLLRSMRKGHRADIARAEKMMECAVYDSGSITREIFEAYRLLHQKAAGRVTRPLATFERMYSWIQQGTAALPCCRREGVPAGFALISRYKDGAYYSSSCEDPEWNHLPIGHLLQWRTMQWLRGHGVRRYEIGWQAYAPLPHAPFSDKEIRIAHFKRGFGGLAVPAWVGEKFYSRAYFEQLHEHRSRAYRESIAAAPQRSGVAR